MSDVFISYSRSDAARAEQLALALKARGFDVWWDPELLPGEQYSKKIAVVLAEAKAIIVIWSKASTASNWVLDEAAVGAQRSNLIPVLIEPVETPLGFRQHQAEDLSRWPDPEGAPAFERVVQALEQLRGKGGEDAAARIKAASQQRLLNRFGIGVGVILALGIGAIALTQIIKGDNADKGDNQTSDENSSSGTDSPGQEANYGFTRAELATFTPQELIQVAMQRTNLEAIDAGAESGDPLGRTLLCLARAYGEGLPAPDPAGARTACEQAAAAGEGLAIYQLSLFTRAGEAGISANAAEADRLLAQASDAGDPRAQTERARAMLKKGDDAGAARLVRFAVDQGYPPAAILYGWMYAEGRGAPRDPGMAFSLYQRAAEAGSAEGLRNTGIMLEDGVGANQDYAQARDRYTLASQLGDGESSFRLAKLNELGRGGAPDADAALRLYRLAASQGYAAAQAEADRLAAAQH
jgi:TPR repeat protein